MVHECICLDVDAGTSQQALGEDGIYELGCKADTIYVGGVYPLTLLSSCSAVRACCSVARSRLAYLMCHAWLYVGLLMCSLPLPAPALWQLSLHVLHAPYSSLAFIATAGLLKYTPN